MKVLVLGCNSMIGQNLIRFIKKAYDSVHLIGVDKIFTYQIESFLDNHYYLNDLQHLTHKSFDCVIHLLCPTGPSEIQNNIETLIYTNTQLIKFCSKLSNRIVFFSSPEVRDLIRLPIKFYFPCRFSYACAKMIAECYCQQFFDSYTIVYPYNMFGPYFRLNDTRLPFLVVKCKYFNQTIKLFNKGLDIRPFTPVTCLENHIQTLLFQQEIRELHIGSKLKLTIKEFVEKVADYKNFVLSDEIRREDFVSSRDCEKCNENVSLEDLKKAFNITYDWFSYLVQTN